MDCSYIKDSRKLYVSWKRGKKPLNTMTQDELIMLDEYIQILSHSASNASFLPSVPSSRSRVFSRFPKKAILFVIFAVVFFLIIR